MQCVKGILEEIEHCHMKKVSAQLENNVLFLQSSRLSSLSVPLSCLGLSPVTVKILSPIKVKMPVMFVKNEWSSSLPRQGGGGGRIGRSQKERR